MACSAALRSDTAWGVIMKWKLLLALVAISGSGCYHMPPAHRMVQPGPGVGGPGPGVLGGAPLRRFPTMQTQVRFVGTPGMRVGWQAATTEGMAAFAEDQIEVPGRYNFAQGVVYQLKLGEVPGRPGIELYPTLEVAPSSPQTDAYLAHNTVPVQFSDEDFDQVLSGNMVTKVVYLPDPEYQELAIAGVETLVSTRLEPGVDPVLEADRRGNILAIVRMGGIDRELPGEAGGMATMMSGLGGAVVPAGAIMPVAAPGMPVSMAGHGGPMGAPVAASPMGSPLPGGGTSPAWGMPMSGTPIGLPGPPHIPFGAPAGLKSHTVRNWTHYNIPHPVDHFSVDVSHTPGISIPKPVQKVSIHENAFRLW